MTSNRIPKRESRAEILIFKHVRTEGGRERDKFHPSGRGDDAPAGGVTGRVNLLVPPPDKNRAPLARGP
jgi:hypothetical protein